MLKYFSGFNNTLIINATNIGNKMNGIGNYTLNLIKQLVRLDSRVNFVIYLNKSCKVHIENITFPNNFKVRWVTGLFSPDKKFIGHLLRLFYSNYLAFKHFNSLQFNTSPLEVCFFKPNQIVTVHDVIPILFKKYHKKQYHFYKIILKYALRFVKVVITPSVYTKELVLKYYGLPENKVEVISLAVEEHSIQNSEVKSYPSPYILYVGRINEMKNVSQVIRSFVIASKYLNVDLIVVGDDRIKFHRLLDEANCDIETKDRIKFYENVSHVEKVNLMRSASLFLYPTLFEGFGFPPLEAMSCGCPVIVSNNSSLPEVCGNAAYFVDPKNENEIAKGIIEVLTNHNLRLQLIEKGFERVQLFSWGKTVSEHLKLIKRILYDSNSIRYTKPSVQESFILREEKSLRNNYSS
jgi:glycosyltransferase involved in cell wall biosynthesis